MQKSKKNIYTHTILKTTSIATDVASGFLIQIMRFEGRRGAVDVDCNQTPRLATKSVHNTQHNATLQKEADILSKLNQAGIDWVPTIREQGAGRFSYHWLPGEPFEKTFLIQPPAVQKKLLGELLNKAYTLDKLGVVHGELDRPTANILIDLTHVATGNAIRMIDFERGWWNDYSGKNCRHIMQYLQRLGLLTTEHCKLRGKDNAQTLYKNLKKIIMNDQKKTHSRAIIGIIVLIFLDLITKRLFYDRERGASTRFLTPILNTGVARSLPVSFDFVIPLTICVVLGLIGYARKHHEWKLRIVLILAGAVGNLIDRIRLGGVRDFIDFHAFPVFNTADTFLTLGCGLLLWEMFFTAKKSP